MGGLWLSNPPTVGLHPEPWAITLSPGRQKGEQISIQGDCKHPVFAWPPFPSSSVLCPDYESLTDATRAQGASHTHPQGTACE